MKPIIKLDLTQYRIYCFLKYKKYNIFYNKTWGCDYKTNKIISLISTKVWLMKLGLPSLFQLTRTVNLDAITAWHALESNYRTTAFVGGNQRWNTDEYGKLGARSKVTYCWVYGNGIWVLKMACWWVYGKWGVRIKVTYCLVYGKWELNVKYNLFYCFWTTSYGYINWWFNVYLFIVLMFYLKETNVSTVFVKVTIVSWILNVLFRFLVLYDGDILHRWLILVVSATLVVKW